jgi:protein SMG8
LPWDIPAQGSDIWPVASKKYKQNRKAKAVQDANAGNCVRYYIGVEYECQRGHRFFMSGPEKLFKAPASGIFKVE